MEMLTREKILSATDLGEAIVECPEWNGSVKVKALSLEKRQAIGTAATGDKGELDNMKLSVITFIEGVIEPKFTPADYEELKKKNSAAMNRVLNKIMQLSGIGVDLKNV